MAKVLNGYGVNTSAQSITLIGTASETEFAHKQQQRKEVFKREAQKVTMATEGLHPCRKVLFMQSGYPETVRRLQGAYDPARHQPVTNRQYSRQPRESRNEEGILAHMEHLAGQTTKEHSWNYRAQRYNKSRGWKATVDKIMVGQGPPPKAILYPQNASHQQLLALTHSLAMPDPRVPPPDISPRPPAQAAIQAPKRNIFGGEIRTHTA